MFTAKIVSKDFVNGALRVTVLFSDGVTSVQESCIPQDFDGLKYWVKSRLTTFNSGQEIDSTFAIDDTIDVSDPVVTPPTPTQAELDRDQWLKDYYKYTKIKHTLVDTGVLTGNEAWLVTLKNRVTNNLLPAYLDLI